MNIFLRVSILIFILTALTSTAIFFIFNKDKNPEKEIQIEGTIIKTPFGDFDETPRQIAFDKQTESDNSALNEIEKEGTIKGGEKSKARSSDEKIFEGRVAGFNVFENSEGETEIFVVEKGRGDRYKINLSKKTRTRVSAGDFIKVKDAYIFKGGKALVLHEDKANENEILSSFVDFVEDGENTQIKFEKNITVTSDNKNSFVFSSISSNISTLRFVDLDNTSSSQKIWGSDLSLWKTHFGRNSFITIYTPISERARSVVYTKDINSNLLTKIGEGKPYGVKIFEDSGHSLTYKTKNNKTGLYLEDFEKKNETYIGATLPEKCVGANAIFLCAVPKEIPTYTKSGYKTIFPDSWYQGDISLSDQIVIIDSITTEKEIISTLDVDVTKPLLQENKNRLFFVDKNDFSLWLIEL